MQKHTSESCGLYWEGVVQLWRNFLFTLAESENKKRIFSFENGKQINKSAWADDMGRSEPPVVVQRHAGLHMRGTVTLWGSSHKTLPPSWSLSISMRLSAAEKQALTSGCIKILILAPWCCNVRRMWFCIVLLEERTFVVRRSASTGFRECASYWAQVQTTSWFCFLKRIQSLSTEQSVIIKQSQKRWIHLWIFVFYVGILTCIFLQLVTVFTTVFFPFFWSASEPMQRLPLQSWVCF